MGLTRERNRALMQGMPSYGSHMQRQEMATLVHGDGLDGKARRGGAQQAGEVGQDVGGIICK